MTKLPRITATGQRLHPSALRITLNQAPLSTASMSLIEGESLQTGEEVELFTPRGSAGIFRVTAVDDVYGEAVEVTLDHGLVTLSDSIIPGKRKKIRSSIREALTTLLEHQTRWTLGVVEVPDEDTYQWSYEYSNLLESLTSIMEKIPLYRLTFDQTVTPWVLNVVRLNDDDACECRLNRNMETLSVTTDRSELCTRLHLRNAGNLPTPMDADTIDRWGVVERTLSLDADFDEEDKRLRAESFLEMHRNPVITVTIDALELSGVTGEAFDSFHLGRMCRVILPDGEPIRQRVTSIEYVDPIAEPERVVLTLAAKVETAADTLAGLIIDKSNVISMGPFVRLNELEAQVLSVLENAEIYRLTTTYLNTYFLNAQTAEITGGLTAGALETDLIICADGSFDALDATEADVGTLRIGGVGYAPRQQTVVVGTGVISVSRNAVTVATPNGGSAFIDYVTGVDYNPTFGTITYLGKEGS